MAKQTWNFEIGDFVTIPSTLLRNGDNNVIFKILNESTNEKGQKVYTLDNHVYSIDLPWYLLRKFHDRIPVQPTGEQNQQ